MTQPTFNNQNKVLKKQLGKLSGVKKPETERNKAAVTLERCKKAFIRKQNDKIPKLARAMIEKGKASKSEDSLHKKSFTLLN